MLANLELLINHDLKNKNKIEDGGPAMPFSCLNYATTFLRPLLLLSRSVSSCQIDSISAALMPRDDHKSNLASP